MRITTYEPKHLALLHAQKSQAEEALWTGVGLNGLSFSAWDGERLIGVGGLQPKWEGVKVVVALFAEGWQEHALPMTRFCRYLLRTEPTPRIEAYVKSDNLKARRWALAIGLKQEARRLQKFGPGGIEMDLFARVK